MNTFKFDVGWLYLIAGLLLAVAAIYIPALIELDHLSNQADESSLQHQYREEMFNSYKSFYDEIQSEDASVKQRVRQVQFNEHASGMPIVTDLAASNTPLQWIDEKVQEISTVKIEESKSSTLSQILSGSGRLWVAALGCFLIFVGCLK
ncbi:MAG: hypothetical protein MK073_06510 [Phycisphaerales bacterium]|nr:hypothetical protein [Phycisphaerales bacterium]